MTSACSNHQKKFIADSYGLIFHTTLFTNGLFELCKDLLPEALIAVEIQHPQFVSKNVSISRRLLWNLLTLQTSALKP